ncbi:MAG: hypothetical protein ACRDPG_09100 [Nocardioidaceae bacterium]
MAATGRTTIAGVASEMARSLGAAEGGAGEAEALRLAFSFIESFDRSDDAERSRMVEEAPVPVGDARFDALLAAIAEHVCARTSLRPPEWTEAPGRFLDTWWFVSGLRSLHADALVHSPVSFSRREVFITGGALAYA